MTYDTDCKKLLELITDYDRYMHIQDAKLSGVPTDKLSTQCGVCFDQVSQMRKYTSVKAPYNTNSWPEHRRLCK